MPKKHKFTDAEIRDMWRDWGGSFHGPNVEHAMMPEANWLKLMRAILNGDLPKVEIGASITQEGTK